MLGRRGAARALRTTDPLRGTAGGRGLRPLASTARGFFLFVLVLVDVLVLVLDDLLVLTPQIDIEIRHLLVEGRAGQAQRLRGARLDPARPLQRSLDLGALERVDLAGQRGTRGGGRLRSEERRVGKEWRERGWRGTVVKTSH